MTTDEMLVELLAIKLFEHSPLGSGVPNTLSWVDCAPEDRQMYRSLVTAAEDPEALYVNAEQGDDDVFEPE